MIELVTYRANSRKGHPTILSGETVAHSIYLSNSYNMTTPSLIMARESHVDNDMVGVFSADIEFIGANLVFKNLIMRVKGNLGFHYFEVFRTLTVETCPLAPNGDWILTAGIEYQTGSEDLATLIRFYIEDSMNELVHTPIAKMRGCELIEIIYARRESTVSEDCRCGEVVRVNQDTITTINKIYKANPTKSETDIYLYATVPSNGDVDMTSFAVIDQDYIANKRLIVQIPQGTKLNGELAYQRCLEHGKYDFFYDADDKNWITEKKLYNCMIDRRSGKALMLNTKDEYEMLNVALLSSVPSIEPSKLMLNTEINEEMLNIAYITKKQEQ